MLAAGPVLAQDHKPLLLIADHVFDARSGTLLDRQAVLVGADGKVAAVGAVETIKAPAGARTVRFPAGTTLLPGLIDAHTHLLETFDTRLGDDDPNTLLNVAEVSTAKRALLGAKHAREDLLAGITTARDLGNSGLNGDVALKAAIEAGWVEGSRLVVSTRALSPVGGQFPRMIAEAGPVVAQEYAVVTGPEQARAAVRQAKYDGADLIKVIVDNAFMSLAPDEMKAIVEEAHRLRMKVAAHAVGAVAAVTAVEAGVDSIEHGYRVSDATLAQMAKAHIYLTPTDSPADSPLWEIGAPSKARVAAIVALGQRRLRKAVELGAPIAFGSDAYYGFPGRTRGETSLETLRAYSQSGMTPAQVIQAATINAATLLGLEAKVGSLEAGKLADIVAVGGDPLKDPLLLQHVGFVMKAGEIVRDEMTAAVGKASPGKAR
jgi:imidazolonepropionase-like amidohydrolase